MRVKKQLAVNTNCLMTRALDKYFDVKLEKKVEERLNRRFPCLAVCLADGGTFLKAVRAMRFLAATMAGMRSIVVPAPRRLRVLLARPDHVTAE